MAIFGLSSSSCRISWRFFSPPEKPSLTLRSAKAESMSRPAIAVLTSLTQCRSFGASPRMAVAAERRKFDTDTPGHLDGVLHGQEHAGTRALVDAHRQHVSAVQRDRARGHLVFGMTGDGVGQRGLAGAVGAHQRMRLTGFHGQVDAVEDGNLALPVGGVGIVDADVQVFDFQSGHEAVDLFRSFSVISSSCSMAAVRRSRTSGTAILEMISPKKPRTTSRRACSSGMPRERR